MALIIESKNVLLPDADISAIPIYIICFNQLTYLKKLINFLEAKGYKNINIIDNKSSYPPLLEYLKNTKHKVHYMDKNYGHKVFWESGKFNKVIETQYYVVTDPDILPTENCPDDFMEVFLRLLQEYPLAIKVGFALKIDDLPDWYARKKDAIAFEKSFWCGKKTKKSLEIYDTCIDTTFALYRPGFLYKTQFFRAIRVGGEYASRHLPWYRNSSEKDEEYEFYKNTASGCAGWINDNAYVLPK